MLSQALPALRVPDDKILKTIVAIERRTPQAINSSPIVTIIMFMMNISDEAHQKIKVCAAVNNLKMSDALDKLLGITE